MLIEEGRYQHVMTPYGDGNEHIHIHNYYAPQGHRDKKNCDCRTILHRMNAYGDVPVIFACDLNDEVADIEVLQSAVEHGIIIDVAAEWATMHGHQPHPTYYSKT
eukprot:6627512-Karenia_brevis.AAC.1